MRRIVFSIAHFPIAATALFFFRLTKLRRTFYVQVECLCFHTGWTRTCRSRYRPGSALLGGERSFAATPWERRVRRHRSFAYLRGCSNPEISPAGIAPSRRKNISLLTTPVAGVGFQRHLRELPSTSLEASLDDFLAGKLTSTLQARSRMASTVGGMG